MGSVAHSLFRMFRGANDAGQPVPQNPTERILRRSSGLREFTNHIAGQQGLRVLDLGPTSPTNITLFTGQGHKIYSEDVLLTSIDPGLFVPAEDGKPVLDVERFLAANLVYTSTLFDAVLCWDIPDYLHESLVKPMVQRLQRALKPGGVLLAFFHTRDAGPDAPRFRYHIVGKDMLELQRGRRFRLQRVFNNRHIENLFRDYASIKFFLARDNVREVLVVR